MSADQCLCCRQVKPLNNKGICHDCDTMINNLDPIEKAKWKRRIKDRRAYRNNPERFNEKSQNQHAKHKEVRNAQRREWRRLNPEEAKAKDKERYDRDREERVQRSRDFRKNNPEKIAQWNHRWYISNKDRVADYKREWNKSNPDKLKAARKRYYLKNYDKLKAKREVYSKNNIEYIRARNRAYYYSEQGIQTRKNYQERCRDARIAYYREYRARNRERLALRDMLRYIENKEQMSARAKEYRQRNHEQIRQKERLRYIANRKTILSKLRIEYYNKNHGKNTRNLYKSLIIRVQNMVGKIDPRWHSIFDHWIQDQLQRKERLDQRGSIKSFGYSTIWSLCHHVASFIKWLDKEKPTTKLSHINRFTVSEYLESQPGHYSGLNKFFNFCRNNKLILVNPCSNITIESSPRKPQSVISLDEQAELFIEAMKLENPPATLAILLTLIHGLTPYELRELSVEDIDQDFQSINVGRLETRSLPLDNDTWSSLLAHLAWRKETLDGRPDHGFIFMTGASVIRGQSVSFNYLANLIKSFNPDLTLGMLRNTYIMELLLATDGNVRLVAEWTGLSFNTLASNASLWGFANLTNNRQIEE